MDAAAPTTPDTGPTTTPPAGGCYRWINGAWQQIDEAVLPVEPPATVQE
jgi:hypothetical protein